MGWNRVYLAGKSIPVGVHWDMEAEQIRGVVKPMILCRKALDGACAVCDAALIRPEIKAYDRWVWPIINVHADLTLHTPEILLWIAGARASADIEASESLSIIINRVGEGLRTTYEIYPSGIAFSTSLALAAFIKTADMPTLWYETPGRLAMMYPLPEVDLDAYFANIKFDQGATTPYDLPRTNWCAIHRKYEGKNKCKLNSYDFDSDFEY